MSSPYEFLRSGESCEVISQITFTGEPIGIIAADGPLTDEGTSYLQLNFHPDAFVGDDEKTYVTGFSNQIDVPHALHLAIGRGKAELTMTQELPELCDQIYEELFEGSLPRSLFPDAPITWHNEAQEGNIQERITVQTGDGTVFELLHLKKSEGGYYQLILRRSLVNEVLDAETLCIKDIANRPKLVVNNEYDAKNIDLIDFEAIGEIIHTLRIAVSEGLRLQEEFKHEIED